MVRLVPWLVCTGAVLAVGLCSAQEADGEVEKPGPLTVELPEYGGVVVDQTLSGLGRAFYVRFSEGWSQLAETESFALAVKERPSPRGGTEVQILSNDSVVLRQFLPRSHAAVINLATTLVERVHGTLKMQMLQAAAGEGGDLARHGY